MNKTSLNKAVNSTVLNKNISNNKTVLNTNVNLDRELLGKKLKDQYIVQSKLDASTGEADLYICSKNTHKYVAKVYRRRLAVKEDITETLKSISSPYVAKVYETGEIDGFPYEILPYYKNGSLEGKTFSLGQLKTSVIPALNEGLKVLHDNGIIHKDLKPSNIMLADNGQDVVIIDFGISSIREDGNTVIITQTGMTPEYSAPETFKNLFLNESDYYSLGITIYELFCGHTPYSQVDPEQIAQFISVQKVPLPDNMPVELKNLISALTYPDITNRKNKANPNRRWGYEEILKWCIGIKQPLPGEIEGSSTVSGDIRPYKFLGAVYTNKQKLIEALSAHWEDGKKQLYRGLLSAYFKGFDAEIAGYCMDAEEEVSTGDDDIIFFKTLYKIDDTMTQFLWKGRKYEDVSTLGNLFLEDLWKGSGEYTSFMNELLEKGVVSQYVLCMDDEDLETYNAVSAIESSYKAFNHVPKQRIIDYYLFSYMLAGRRTLYKYDREFDSVRDLTEYLKTCLSGSYEDFEKKCHELMNPDNSLDGQFEAWLLSLGKKKEINEWKQSLSG